MNENQKEFVKKCENAGLEVYQYSGRGMYGKRCPAVNVDYLSDFPGNPHDYWTDSMGMGYVVYCR